MSSSLKRISEALDQGRLIHRGMLTEIYNIRLGNRDLIIKRYPLDVAEAFTAEKDPRFTEILHMLPLAPFISSSHDLIEAIRPALHIELPRILDEGRLLDGSHFTLMSRVAGAPWPRPTTEAVDAKRSRDLGRIARAIHSVSMERDWPDHLPAAFTCLIDHLPASMDRKEIRCCWERISKKLGGLDMGPVTVVHGDLHPSNCLFNDQWEICGLVDFQLSMIGPASLDFRCLPALDHRAFLEAYGMPEARHASCLWLGSLIEALYEGLAIMVEDRYLKPRQPLAARVFGDQFLNLMKSL